MKAISLAFDIKSIRHQNFDLMMVLCESQEIPSIFTIHFFDRYYCELNYVPISQQDVKIFCVLGCGVRRHSRELFFPVSDWSIYSNITSFS